MTGSYGHTEYEFLSLFVKTQGLLPLFWELEYYLHVGYVLSPPTKSLQLLGLLPDAMNLYLNSLQRCLSMFLAVEAPKCCKFVGVVYLAFTSFCILEGI